MPQRHKQQGRLQETAETENKRFATDVGHKRNAHHQLPPHQLLLPDDLPSGIADTQPECSNGAQEENVHIVHLARSSSEQTRDGDGLKHEQRQESPVRHVPKKLHEVGLRARIKAARGLIHEENPGARHEFNSQVGAPTT